ncbi:MAG: permease-like cell division protein FtsX [Candidatus Berkelbacteria bacterium]|nr:permease-like cell division protein FtsX [Candidatus Berkelbacteria bacterium]
MQSTGLSNFMIMVGRIFKMSILSFWRNRLLSLATTVIIVLALFIISVFSLTIIVANKAASALRDKVDLTVYLKDADTLDQVDTLEEIVKSRPEVKSLKFLSKDDALAVWQQSHADNSDIANVISATDNPLPRSFEIQTVSPEQIETVANFLDNQDYASLIQEISYKRTKDIVDRLVRITGFISTLGLTLSLIFMLVSVLIVYNTLRLTIYSRSDEIEIMKLVGASDSYVRAPFMIEGMAFGFIGAIISSIIFYTVYHFSLPPAENYLGIADLSSSLSKSLWLIIASQFVIGLVMGALCSLVAMRQYLFGKNKK